MKKAPLILAILLFLASGVAFVYGSDNFTAASGYQALAEKTLEKMKTTQDMTELQKLKDDMDIFYLPPIREHKQRAMLGFGGGVVLLAGSIILFLKARRRSTT